MSTQTQTPKKNEYADLEARKEKQKDCKVCEGYGLWAMGDSSPMGPIDFGDGEPVKLCPECGSGRREKTWRRADGLVIPIEELTDKHLKNIVLHLDERKEGDTPVRKMMEEEVRRRKK